MIQQEAVAFQVGYTRVLPLARSVKRFGTSALPLHETWCSIRQQIKTSVPMIWMPMVLDPDLSKIGAV